MALLVSQPRVMALAALLLAAPEWAASPDFAVIVHRSNGVANLSLPETRALFEGNKPRWADHSKVVLAERDPAGAATAFMTGRLLKVSLTDYKRNLAGLEFKGAEPVTLRILNSDQAACKFVFNVPSAVALIEAASLALPECGQVRVVQIEGRLPGEKGYRLK